MVVLEQRSWFWPQGETRMSSNLLSKEGGMCGVPERELQRQSDKGSAVETDPASLPSQVKQSGTSGCLYQIVQRGKCTLASSGKRLEKVVVSTSALEQVVVSTRSFIIEARVVSPAQQKHRLVASQMSQNRWLEKVVVSTSTAWKR
jgi:hypothetical protein